jgi:phospholipid/cholesterol/gamma-HCH transport system substrate-binding protein
MGAFIFQLANENTMENKNESKIKLGVFVSVSIGLFIVGIYLIGQRQKLFVETFQVSGVFADINGLQVGNNVRFSGINVGIVETIAQETDSTVRVGMQVVEDTRRFIKKDAIAIIGSDGLMGSKTIVIVAGAGDMAPLADHDVIQTLRQVSMDEIMANLKTTSDNAATITSDLAIVMDQVKSGRGTIGMLLMDSLFADNLRMAIYNIKAGAGGFKQNMDAAGHNFLLRGYIKKQEKGKDKAKDLEKDKGKDKKDKEEKEAETKNKTARK